MLTSDSPAELAFYHRGRRAVVLRDRPDGSVELTHVGGGLTKPVASRDAGIRIAERILRMLSAGDRNSSR